MSTPEQIAALNEAEAELLAAKVTLMAALDDVCQAVDDVVETREACQAEIDNGEEGMPQRLVAVAEDGMRTTQDRRQKIQQELVDLQKVFGTIARL